MCRIRWGSALPPCFLHHYSMTIVNEISCDPLIAPPPLFKQFIYWSHIGEGGDDWMKLTDLNSQCHIPCL